MKTTTNIGVVNEINKAAIPLVFTQITAIIMGIIDQALVGHISIDAYGAVGLVVAVINSLVGVLGALSIVFNIVGSKVKEDSKKLNEDFNIFIIICLGIGIPLFLIFYFMADIVLGGIFGLTGKALEEGSSYLKIFSLSIPINLIIFILSSTLKIFRETNYILRVSIITNIINIVLDYSLIFGKFGMPSLGAKGAAIGTVIGLASNLLMYYYIIRSDIKVKFNICGLKDKAKQYIEMSLPFIGQEIMEDILFVVLLNAMIARVGIIELASYNLVFQVISIVLMPMFAYVSINTSLVSEAYEKKDIKFVKDTTKITLSILVIWFVVMYTLIFFGKDLIPGIITNDKSLISFTSQILPVAIFIQIFNYGLNIYKSTLQAMGEAKWTLYSAAIINMVIIFLIMLIGGSLNRIYILIGAGYIFMWGIYKYRFNKIVKA